MQSQKTLENINKLDAILKEYAKLYNSDITNLRNNINPSEMWRFFIDIDRQHEGWLRFEETEPGYLQAMALAFQKIFQPQDDLEKLAKDLHYTAISGIKNSLYTKPKTESKEYRIEHNARPGLPARIITEAGTLELLQEIKDCKNTEDFLLLELLDREKDCGVRSHIYLYPDNSYVYENGIRSEEFTEKHYLNYDFKKLNQADIKTTNQFNDTSVIFTYLKIKSIQETFCLIKSYLFSSTKELRLNYFVNDGKADGPQVAATMDLRFKSYIKEYKASIKEAKFAYEKLMTIVKFIRNCERLHPFLDGNTRTFSMLLLNHLLIHNGFPIVIRDPNVCYAITIDEMSEDMICGMRSTLELAQGKFLRNIATTDILEKANSDGIDAFKRFIAIEIDSRNGFDHTEPASPTDSKNDNKADAVIPQNNDIISIEEKIKIKEQRILEKLKRDGIENVLIIPYIFMGLFNSFYLESTKTSLIDLLTPKWIKLLIANPNFFIFIEQSPKNVCIAFLEKIFKNNFNDFETFITANKNELKISNVIANNNRDIFVSFNQLLLWKNRYFINPFKYVFNKLKTIDQFSTSLIKALILINESGFSEESDLICSATRYPDNCKKFVSEYKEIKDLNLLHLDRLKSYILNLSQNSSINDRIKPAFVFLNNNIKIDEHSIRLILDNINDEKALNKIINIDKILHEYGFQTDPHFRKLIFTEYNFKYNWINIDVNTLIKKLMLLREAHLDKNQYILSSVQGKIERIDIQDIIIAYKILKNNNLLRDDILQLVFSNSAHEEYAIKAEYITNALIQLQQHDLIHFQAVYQHILTYYYGTKSVVLEMITAKNLLLQHELPITDTILDAIISPHQSFFTEIKSILERAKVLIKMFGLFKELKIDFVLNDKEKLNDIINNSDRINQAYINLLNVVPFHRNIMQSVFNSPILSLDHSSEIINTYNKLKNEALEKEELAWKYVFEFPCYFSQRADEIISAYKILRENKQDTVQVKETMMKWPHIAKTYAESVAKGLAAYRNLKLVNEDLEKDIINKPYCYKQLITSFALMEDSKLSSDKSAMRYIREHSFFSVLHAKNIIKIKQLSKLDMDNKKIQTLAHELTEKFSQYKYNEDNSCSLDKFWMNLPKKRMDSLLALIPTYTKETCEVRFLYELIYLNNLLPERELKPILKDFLAKYKIQIQETLKINQDAKPNDEKIFEESLESLRQFLYRK